MEDGKEKQHQTCKVTETCPVESRGKKANKQSMILWEVLTFEGLFCPLLGRWHSTSSVHLDWAALVHQHLLLQVGFPGDPLEVKLLLCLLYHCNGVGGPGEILSYVHTKKPKSRHPFHTVLAVLLSLILQFLRRSGEDCGLNTTLEVSGFILSQSGHQQAWW